MDNESEILITGGTGILGQALAEALTYNKLNYHITSRSNSLNKMNWTRLDMETGEGMRSAVFGKKIVFHLASDTKKFSERNDVNGTRLLLDVCKRNQIKHFIYISIVGIDSIPFSYYQNKLKAEEEIKRSGINFTILRATQFHDFVDLILNGLLKYPVLFVPKKINIQPIETKTVADMLTSILNKEPLNGTIDIGGPEVITSGDLIDAMIKAQNISKSVFNIPFPGKLGRALMDGNLTCKEKAAGSLSWNEWLDRKYSGRKY